MNSLMVETDQAAVVGVQTKVVIPSETKSIVVVSTSKMRLVKIDVLAVHEPARYLN